MIDCFKRKIIVRYAGGLGNQMFQYALRCNFEMTRSHIRDDISYYDEVPNAMPFCLLDVFPNINLTEASEMEIDKYLRRNKSKKFLKKIYNKIFPVQKKYYCEERELKFDSSILSKKEGYFSGYWQSYKYTEPVKNILLERFQFREINEKKIREIAQQMVRKNAVSLHIRAGDYLLPQNIGVFGGICTLDYYRIAINIMCEKINNPIFYVFSNDINWCKDNIFLNNVVWMDENTLPPHEDWVDMYLMSCCKHNIVANSSFSWWAAWLNKNPEKIVIAPKKWLQTVQGDEICPKEWIRI